MKHSAQSLRHFPPAEEPPHRAIRMDLADLIAPYRGRGPFTLRVENLPQSARLSAGQNNGDHTWSLLLHELEGLTYYPPRSAHPEHMLALRLIAKDDTEADTIALIDLPVHGGAEVHPLPAPVRPASLATGSLAAGQSDEIAALKTELAGRETELAAMRASVSRVEKHWREKLDIQMMEAEIIWSKEEALRATVLRTGLEEEFAAKLAAAVRRSEAESQTRSNDSIALDEARNALIAARDAAAAAKAEQQRFVAKLEDLRRHSEAEIAAAKAKAADALKSAEAAWTAQSEKKLAELTAQLKKAEDGTRNKDHESEIAAVKAQAAEALKNAEAAWAAQSEKKLAELTTQLKTIEERSRKPDRENEIAELKTQLAHQRLLAETALAAAPAREQADDAYVRGLEREIKSLRATLADREASIARARAQEAAMPRPAPAQPSIRWRANRETDEPAPGNSKLLRDAALVIVAVILAVLFAPRIGLPADISAMVQSWLNQGGETQAAVQPAPPPKPVGPAPASVTRAVKLRAGPSVSAAVAANLKAGVQVGIIEKRGNWTHVRILEPNAPVKDGWVYGSYLSP